MKIKHYICPKACGKTTFAENLQKEDPSLLLIQRGYTITNVHQLFDMFRGRNDSYNTYTGIIIDEFLPITNLKDYSKSYLLEFFKYLGVEEAILISTPDRLYNFIEDYKELSSKFLNIKDGIEIVETDFGNKKSKEEQEYYYNSLGENKYKTDILGAFLTLNKETVNDFTNKKYSYVRLRNLRFE